MSALIWQARVATHSRGARAFAAHGYVDEAYRPPRLPFISVVGPLGIQPEPDRENGKTAHLKLRIPGTLVGTPRPLLGAVPTGGSLRIRFDGYAYVTLTGLPGGSFTST
ncbi:MAG TPA: hypothetical protein VEY30_08855, partial [Myxococcaceae bacterium]|nr:hypothetical protein [Myxococcaceae bacterium]